MLIDRVERRSGEVVISGPNVMRGDLNRPGKSDKPTLRIRDAARISPTP
jgi:acyl-CoA synthetase (AMP-forming)/AMP-acid ligase II